MIWDWLVQLTGKYCSIRRIEYPEFETGIFGRMESALSLTFQLFDVLTPFCFISQSNNSKHSNKQSDWTRLVCLLMTPQLAIRNTRYENMGEFLKKMTCSLS